MASMYFGARMLTPDTYVITGDGCDCYLLLGEDEALMIDAGMSKHDIRAFAQSLTHLPVRRVINTHGHFDHTAGNGFFDAVLATEGISRNAKNTMGAPFADYRLDYAFTIVGDGDVVNLAGRPLEIIELDCHSPGNLAVLDRTRRLLFPGDELESGQVLLLPGYAEVPGELHARPASSVERYLNAMRKLNGFRGAFDWICPSHNGSPIDPGYLDLYIECAERILNGHEGNRDIAGRAYSPNAGHFPKAEANYRRAEYKGASIVYCADLLTLEDERTKEQYAPATELHRVSAGSVYG